LTETDASRTVPAVPPVPSRRPPTRRTVRWLVVAAIVTLSAVTGAFAWRAVGGDPSAPRFEVRDQFSGEVYYSRAIELAESFDLQHTHSVTRRPVIETFSAADADTIAIEEMWFDQNGPNLPTGPEPLGDGETTFIYEDDGSYRVIHHSYPLGTVPLLVGSESVDHTLTFSDGDKVRLLDIADRGAAVEFRVRPG